MNQKLWKIHQWLGLYTGLVIGVLCFTGVLALFIPEVESALYLQKNQVKAIEAKDYQLTDLNLKKIMDNFPDFKLFSVKLPDTKTDPIVAFIGKSGPSKLDTRQYHVYINPHNGSLLTFRNHLDGITNFIRQFHVRLFDNWYGRQIVGLAGLGLLGITITGLLIYGGFMRKQNYGEIRKHKGSRIYWGDWHKLIGITALAFNFVIAFTGAWLGLQPKLMNWLDIEAPNRFERKAIIGKQVDQDMTFDISGILKESKKKFPEMIPSSISFSDDGSSTIEVNGDIKGAVYERGSFKQVFDKSNLNLLFQFDTRQADLSGKLYLIQEALHFGDFAGIPLKILYGLFGLTGSFLSVSGFFIYLKRSKQEKNQTTKITAKRKVWLWTVATVFITFIIALAHLIIGYVITSAVVTISVYVTLGVLSLMLIIKSIKKFRYAKT